jgi:hypothetical protein
MDHGEGRDSLAIGVGLGFAETGGHSTRFTVEKWDKDQVDWTRRRLDRSGHRPLWEPSKADFEAVRVRPFDIYDKEDCNLITDVGWAYIMNGFAGSSVTKFVNATTGRIGLGVSATAVAYADTALNSIGALTTANWKVINAVPTVGNHSTGLILAAQFGLTEANGVSIQEFGTDLGTTSTLATTAVGGLVTHGNATPGTKTSSQTWNATVTITWT